MKERIIKDLPMLIVRTIVTIEVYLIFRFIEFKKKK